MSDVDELQVRSNEDLRRLLSDCRRYATAEEQLIIDNSTPPIEAVGLSKSGTITLIVNNAPNLETLVDSVTMVHMNLMKSILIEYLRILNNPFIAIAFALTLLSNKKRHQYITSFNRLGSRIIKEDILKPMHMTNFSNELEFMVYEFIKRSGIEDRTAYSFAEIISHVFEHDAAYRHRIKDMFSETTAKKLSDRPIREIRRLVSIYCSREDGNTKDKVKMVVNMLCMILLIPKYKKIFRDILKKVEFNNLQRTQADDYWMYYMSGYRALGMTKNEHREYIIKTMGIKPKYRA